jgi:hypothetical protein
MNASITNEPCANTSSANSSANTSGSESEPVSKGMLDVKLIIFIKLNIVLLLGLSSWREAVQRSVTAAQLSMALYTLEQCVAWDKSIMKAVRLSLILFLDKAKKNFSFSELPILSVR